MANLTGIIYLSTADYETLIQNGSVVIDGETLIYDENTVYVIPEMIDTLVGEVATSSTRTTLKFSLKRIESQA